MTDEQQEIKDVGQVAIDTGRLVLVDPCFLNNVEELMEKGLAVMVDVPGGDCWLDVWADGDYLVIPKPYEFGGPWEVTEEKYQEDSANQLLGRRTGQGHRPAVSRKSAQP